MHSLRHSAPSADTAGLQGKEINAVRDSIGSLLESPSSGELPRVNDFEVTVTVWGFFFGQLATALGLVQVRLRGWI